jgi:hypothetical protein
LLRRSLSEPPPPLVDRMSTPQLLASSNQRQLTSSTPLPAYPVPLLGLVGVDVPESVSDGGLIRLCGGDFGDSG